MQNEIFNISIKNWKTNYRKLGFEDAERYAIDLLEPSFPSPEPSNVYSVGRPNSRYGNYSNFRGELISGNKWTTTGLSLQESDFSQTPENFAFLDAGAFIGFGSGRPYQKVTTVRNFAADPVENFRLNLGQPINVYLMPRLMAQTITNLGAEFDPSGLNSVMVGPYRPLSRQFWVNFNWDPPIPNQNVPFFSSFFESGVADIRASPAKAAQIVNHIQSHPLTRSFTYSTETGGTFTTGFTGNHHFFYSEASAQNAFSGLIVDNAVSNPPNLPIGLLAGVIEQAGVFYYFWINGEAPFGSPNDNPSISKGIQLIF